MTAHQIEQVTPRIHLTSTNQNTRTWEQPKIRLHNSAQSTPPAVRQLLPSHHFKTTRVRVTAPSDNCSSKVAPVLNASPVTHPAIPKPLRFRIAGTHPEQNTICRQLFTNVTPSKRPRQAAPAFRLSCGRERTQPSSDPPQNPFVNSLDAQISQAQENVHIFRNGLLTNQSDNSFRTTVTEGLFFDVSFRRSNLLILRPHARPDQEGVEFAVIVTDEMLSEQVKYGNKIDYSGRPIFIPHPWHAQLVNGYNAGTSRVLIAAHNLETFRREHLTSLETLTINAALDKLPVHDTSAPAECPPFESFFRFAALSPHSIITKLSVFVDSYEPSHQLAVIRDDVGEVAVLVTKSTVLEASSRKFVLNSVLILPYRVLSHVILHALGDKFDERLHNRLILSGDQTSYLAFRHEENLEQ